MCLDTLSRQIKDKYGKQRTGYKVFLLDAEGGLCSTDQGWGGVKPRDEWLNESFYRITSSKFAAILDYRLGFHVCLTRAGADAWARSVGLSGHKCKTVNVAFRYPTAWGYQNNYPMAVARQIMILEDA